MKFVQTDINACTVWVGSVIRKASKWKKHDAPVNKLNQNAVIDSRHFIMPSNMCRPPQIEDA